MQLTQHFTLAELSKSSTADRLGLDNTPPPEVLPALTSTAEMLEAFRSFKGAMKVLEWIGKAAKPMGYVVGLGASIAAFWTAMKSGVTPK